MKKNRQKSQKYKNIVHTIYRRPIETEPFSIKSIFICFVDGEIHEENQENQQKKKKKEKNIYVENSLYLTMFVLIDTFLLVGAQKS